MSSPEKDLSNPALAPRSLQSMALTALWLIVFSLALRFINSEALTYRQVDEETFGRFWAQRFWLLGHVTGGTLALLVGAAQLVPAIRRRYLRVHRWLGRVYLLAVVTGASCCFVQCATTALQVHWTWSLSLLSLSVPWLVSSLMGYRAIRLRRITQHKEWMIRSYVLTFGFVIFRVLNIDLFSDVGTFVERGPSLAWAAWAIPLFLVEVFLQWNKQEPPGNIRDAVR